MGTISRPNSYSPNTTIQSSQVNADFNTIYSEFNGNISSSNVDTTIVTTTATQTLTNKTLTKPIVNGSVQGVASYSPSAAATATLDLSTANINLITMPAGNITIAISNGATGQFFVVEIVQDSTGSRTVTWFSTIKWTQGTIPTLTTTANKKDTFGFRITGTNTYDGYVVGQNI